MRAATNWATHTTAFLTRRLPVVSRAGRIETSSFYVTILVVFWVNYLIVNFQPDESIQHDALLSSPHPARWTSFQESDPLAPGRDQEQQRILVSHLTVCETSPTGSETTAPYASRSSRFGSEPPSVEDAVDVWRYAILRVVCQKRRRRRVGPTEISSGQ